MGGSTWVSISHYLITVIFFLSLLFAIIQLTMSLLDMNVNESDSDATSAEAALKDAVVIGWISIVLIVLGLLGVGIMGFRGEFESSGLKKTLTYLSGTDKIFLGMRIVIFSILVGSSFIIASLLTIAASYIEGDPQYSDQYDAAIRFSRIMYLRIILLCFIQGMIYLSTWMYNA